MLWGSTIGCCLDRCDDSESGRYYRGIAGLLAPRASKHGRKTDFAGLCHLRRHHTVFFQQCCDQASIHGTKWFWIAAGVTLNCFRVFGFGVLVGHWWDILRSLTHRRVYTCLIIITSIQCPRPHCRWMHIMLGLDWLRRCCSILILPPLISISATCCDHSAVVDTWYKRATEPVPSRTDPRYSTCWLFISSYVMSFGNKSSLSIHFLLSSSSSLPRNCTKPLGKRDLFQTFNLFCWEFTRLRIFKVTSKSYAGSNV